MKCINKYLQVWLSSNLEREKGYWLVKVDVSWSIFGLFTPCVAYYCESISQILTFFMKLFKRKTKSKELHMEQKKKVKTIHGETLSDAILIISAPISCPFLFLFSSEGRNVCEKNVLKERMNICSSL